MKRVLLTGMSGTGKSTLIDALTARGFKAIDADDEAWSEWVDDPDPDEPPTSPDSPAAVWQSRDWVWREDRISHLLATEDAAVLFVSGCAPNQGKFYPQFDQIVLLSAPAHLLAERLATRSTNAYGKHPDELARIMRHVETVEPRLRRGATLEIDTSAPVEQVLQTLLDHVRP